MRITSLDGVRGLAALVVLFHHSLLVLPLLALPYFGEDTEPGLAWLIDSPVHVGWLGSEAVLVFFVLSGLVVSAPFLRTPPTITWRAYYPSRLVRLYLPVIASVALALVFYVAIPRAADAADSLWVQDHDRPVTLVTVAMTCFLLIATSMFNSPLWSLRWEMWFSLLLPLYVVIARARRLRVAAAVALVAVLVATGLNEDFVAVFYLASFGVGVALTVVLDRLRALRITDVTGWLLLAVVAVALTWQWTAKGLGWEGLASAWRPMAVLGAVLAIVLALAWPRAGSALNARPVQWLGLVSFSLYLTHEPVIVSLAHVIPTDVMWLVPILAPALCLPLAWAFHRLVEAPSHRLARSLRRRVEGRHRTARNATASI